MGFHSLYIEPTITRFDNQYTYLEIVRPEPRQEGKKKTQAEIKEFKERLAKYNATIKKLNEGKCNLYNNPIKMDSIINHWVSKFFDEFTENMFVYKINPTSSKIISGRYPNGDEHMVWEFDVLSKISNRDEFISQIVNDGLLQEFYHEYFISKCYVNHEYKGQLIEFMEYIKERYPNEKIYLSGIIRENKYPYERKIKDVYEITRENIRHAVENGYISLYKEWEDVENILQILLEMKLFDIALKYIKEIPKDQIHYITDKNGTGYSKVEPILVNNTDDEFIKEIIDFLSIKLSGVILTVTKIEYKEYGNDKETVVERTRFDDVGKAKSQIIKQYDVPFEELKKDVCDIYFRPDKYLEYKFKIE